MDNDDVVFPGFEESPMVQINAITNECFRYHDIYSRQDFAIVDETTHKLAQNDLVAVQQKFDEVDGFRQTLTKPLLETKRRIDTLFDRPLKWLKESEENIKQAIVEYRAQREVIRETIKEEHDQLLDKAMGCGDLDALTLAASLPVEQVKDELPGYHIWKYDVHDLRELAKAVADGTAPLHYIMPNDHTLRAHAKTHKNTKPVPGVQFYPERVIRGRRKKDGPVA